MKTTTTLYDESKRDERETYIVFGTARGGTSMVAGCMAGLGVHMGNNLPQNYEDPEFVNKPVESMKATIERKGLHHTRWGWKYPEASIYLDRLKLDIPNPRIIVVFRDLVAIASRQNISNGVDIENGLVNNSLLLQRNIALVLKWQVPTLLVSYEKAVSFKSEFLDELATFVDFELPEDRAEIIDFMQPGSYKATFANRYVT